MKTNLLNLDNLKIQKLALIKPFLRFSLGSLLLILYFACWSLATPVGSSPDDGYHLSSIWCHNSSENECQPKDSFYRVPTLVAGITYGCFAQNGEIVQSKYNKSAKCIEEGSSGFSRVTYLNNNTKMYPEIFYSISSLFVGKSVEHSVLSIRFFWGFVFGLFFFVALATSSVESRRVLKLTLLIFLAPVTAFLIASTNPSSGSLTGILFLPIFLDLSLSGNRRIRHIGVLMVLLASLLASGSRADGGLFVLLIVGAWLIARSDKLNLKKFVISSLLPILTAICLILKIIKSSNSVGIQAVVAHPTSSFFSIDSLIYNSTHLYRYYMGLWGLDWSLGWKAEPKLTEWIPIMQALIALTIFIAFVRIKTRNALLLVSYILIITIAMPLYLFQVTGSRVGEFVQPRYMLPFALAATYLIFAKLTPHLKRIGITTKFVLASAFTFVSATTFYTQVTRVTKGASGNLFSEPKPSDWWWSIKVIPPEILFIAFVIVSIIFSFFLISEWESRKIKRADEVQID